MLFFLNKKKNPLILYIRTYKEKILKKLSVIGLAVITALTLSACGDNKTNTNESKSQPTTQEKQVNTEVEKPTLSEKEIYKEGVHYKVVSGIDVNVESPFIVEYFWLGCLHCQSLEPVVKLFLNDNKDVKLVRRHAALQERWGLDARVYYALEKMNKLDHFDELFKLYADKANEKTLPSKEDIDVFLKAANINSEEFFKVADSEEVLNMISVSIKEMYANNMTGVPGLVVNGKYLATPNEDIKTYQDYMNLISFLLKK